MVGRQERVHSGEKWSQQRGVGRGQAWVFCWDSVGVAWSPEAGAPERPLCELGLVLTSRSPAKVFIYDSKQGTPERLRALSSPGHPGTQGSQTEVPPAHGNPREPGLAGRVSGWSSPRPRGAFQPQARVPPQRPPYP